MKVPFANVLFDEESAGTFTHGHIFINPPVLTSGDGDLRPGYWHCDIVQDNKLSWSDKVHELFGLSSGTEVERDWAVARYTESSRAALEKVRTYALGRKFGFILDAVIKLEEGHNRSIRILAYPIVARGKVVGLHGLKRAL